MLTLQFRQATGFQIISDRRRGYLVNGGCVRFLSAQSPDVEDGTSYKDLSGVRVNALTTTAKTCGRQAKSSVSRFSPNWPCLRSSWPLDCARLKRTWPHVRPQVQSPGTSRERDRERERESLRGWAGPNNDEDEECDFMHLIFKKTNFEGGEERLQHHGHHVFGFRFSHFPPQLLSRLGARIH